MNKVDYVEASKFIDYNPLTGEIKHLARKDAKCRIDKNGYLVIKVKGKLLKCHRLAYTKYYGRVPKFTIDHINHIRSDNRISNLEDVPQKINNDRAIKKVNKDTGVYGIWVDKKTKGLLAKFTTVINGKTYRFRDLDEAIKFRREKIYGNL